MPSLAMKRALLAAIFIVVVLVGILMGIWAVRRAAGGKPVLPGKATRETAQNPCLAVSEGNARDLCWLEQAFQKKDPAVCNALPADGRREECARRVAAALEPPAPVTREAPAGESEPITGFVPLDSDNDGLSDADERKHSTDPWNPDSDRDGFSDGAEVKNGFNPLGSGKL